MITTIFFTVCCILLLLLWLIGAGNRDYFSEDSMIGRFILTITILGVAFLVWSGILAGIPNLSYVETSRDTHTVKIFSLKTTDSISGKFFVGSGYINGTEYYYMFAQDDRGAYYRIRYNSQDCNIFEDASPTNCYILWQTIHYRVPARLIEWPVLVRQEDTQIDIHVPPNTIIQQFQVQ